MASGVRAWGVNPNRDEVAGLRCYPSVAELPEVPVCAFLMVNHERVEAAFEEAAAAGVRAFVVPGVGAEAGEAAKPTTERLARRARELGATLLGPNCMGFFVPGGAAAWNGRPQDTTAPGHVAVLCQSGSIADAFLSLGGRIGLRCVVSSGAEAVTDAADFLAFFAEDPGTRAVGLFLETVRRPDAFVDALRRCAEAGKPVVCLKVGRSEAAARAALSHTGALVGSDRAFSAVLRRYSAVEVGDFHELVETLEILGRDRWPGGTRIAGISESGGECALLADHAESAGIPFEPLSSRLTHALSTAFPNYLAPGNPLDAWGIADETEVYPRSLELLAESGEFDVLFAQADLSQFRDETNDEWCELTLRTLARLARDNEALFCAMTTVHSADPPRHFQELARELDVPLLRGPRDAMLALAKVARRRPFTDVGVRRRSAGPLGPPERLGHALRARVLARPRAARRSRSHSGSAQRRRKRRPRRQLRSDHGWWSSPTALRTRREAEASFSASRHPTRRPKAARRLGGSVLVARQVDPGTEVLCGMTRDADFGPILAVGRGGVDVEDSTASTSRALPWTSTQLLTSSPRRASTIHTESSRRPSRRSAISRSHIRESRPWRSTRSSSGRLTPWQSTRSSSSRIDRGLSRRAA